MLETIGNRLLSIGGAMLLLVCNPTSAADCGLTKKCPELRCYCRVDPSSSTNVEVKRVEALDPKSNGNLQIEGRWWSITSVLANMFYTKTPHKELVEACNYTFIEKKIKADLAMYAAAEHRASYNYTVWNVDTTDTKNEQEKINRIVAFGDSLSDTTNFRNGASGLNDAGSATYYAGRFTNGKIWLDYLSDELNLPVYNWSIAGAGTENFVSFINGTTSQVQSWLDYMNTDCSTCSNLNAINKFYNPSNTLFTMLIGGNDLLTYKNSVERMLANQEYAITKLIEGGARNIVLINLPDLSRTPVFLIRYPDPRERLRNQEITKREVIAYNDGLQAMVDTMNTNFPKTNLAGKLNIQVFDAYTLLNGVLDNPASYGFTNTTDSCLAVTEETVFTYAKSGEPRNICKDGNGNSLVNSFVYFDLMHPTTRTHKVLADKLVHFVRKNFPVGN